MSTKHLRKGDPCPPLAKGVLRIYSMKFCPYAERTRLVMHAKNIQHELVNVNTVAKPEWFVDKNPEAKVPVLEKDGQIVYESLITSDYLDELYPDNRPMWPHDAYQKARDKILLGTFGDKIDGAFWASAKSGGQDAALKEKFRKEVEKLEVELKHRGTNFFGGDLPGMLDYMMWPFFVRLRSHRVLGEDTDLPDSMPVLIAWKARMMGDSSVKSTWLPDKVFTEFITHYRTRQTASLMRSSVEHFRGLVQERVFYLFVL